MKPTTGRIVLFRENGKEGEQLPAIVTKAHDDTTVDLHIFNRGNTLFKSSVVQGDEPGQWNWPTMPSTASSAIGILVED